jgi:hypothetical protein
MLDIEKQKVLHTLDKHDELFKKMLSTDGKRKLDNYD